jgi:guanylate cyclase
MYGLLLDAICETLQNRFGETTMAAIKEKAGIHQTSFITSKMYSESLIARLTKAAHEVTGTSTKELMGTFGESFVPFVDQHGYGRILKVLGRNMRDFLNGLDNLHEYIRFTYPKLKPPSFFCEAESTTGLTLHYRSRRKGFLHYVMGQIRAVGQGYYNMIVDIEIVKEEETLDMTHVIMRLHFDNRAFERSITGKDTGLKLEDLQLSSEVFFDVFPFHIVFNKTLIVQSMGSGLTAVMRGIVGQSIDEVFFLTRPLVDFSLSNVSLHFIVWTIYPNNSQCTEILFSINSLCLPQSILDI